MKKILFLFILMSACLFLNMNNVHASEYNDPTLPLVVSVGTDINEYLKCEGYVVVSNTVNTNVAGNYSITYRSIEDNIEVRKPVFVIADTKFATETDILTSPVNESKYALLKAIATENGYYYAESYQNPRFVRTSYYLYYEDNTSRLIRNNSHCTINNLNYVDGHNLVIANENDTATGGFDMLVCDYAEGLNSTFKIPIDGVEYGMSITSSSDTYFIGGYATEENDVFLDERLGDDSFILFVDKTTKVIRRCLMLSVQGHDEISDIYFINNYLYALQNIDNHSLRLLKIDIFGNVVAENIIEHPYGVRDAKLKYYNNRLTLSYGYYDYNYLDYVDTIVELNTDLVRKTLYDAYNKNLRLVDYELKDGLQLQAIFSYKNNRPGFVYAFIDNSNFLFDYYNIDDCTPVLICHNKILCSKDSGYVIKALDTLFIESAPPNTVNPKTDTKDVLDNYKIYLNGVSCKCEDDSKLYYDETLFGKQKVTYHFKDTYDFLMDVNLNVLPFIGVEDGKTYDLNTIISGNAKIRINGELIESSYCLDEVGEYEIELTGLNNESVKYFINVVDTSKYEKVDKPNEELEVSLNDVTSTKDATLSFQKRSTKVSKNNGYLFVYIVPFILLGVGFLVLKRGH